MRLRTVIIALSVFFISALIIFFLWVREHREPSQVLFMNRILNNKLVSNDNSEWFAEEKGMYYQLFCGQGEKNGYTRMVVTVNVNKTTDLSNIRQIAEHYFPDKADEICSVILAKNDKFKSKKIDIVDYKYAEGKKELTVRAFNVNKDQYVSMEIKFLS